LTAPTLLDPTSPPAQIGSAMVEMQRGEKASLLLRVRSLDPRRPCVKDHNKWGRAHCLARGGGVRGLNDVVPPPSHTTTQHTPMVMGPLVHRA
jgi:hypothetical protein